MLSLKSTGLASINKYRGLSVNNFWLIVNTNLLTTLDTYAKQMYEGGMKLSDLNWDKFKGQGVILYDSIGGISINRSANIPTEPQENGELFAYDKVQQPNEVTVTLYFSEGQPNQILSMYALNSAVGSMATFLIITPNDMFSDMAVVGFTTQRNNERNTSLVVAEVRFRQVLSVKTEKMDLVGKNPTSSEKVSSGLIQSYMDKTSGIAQEALDTAKNWVSKNIISKVGS